MLGEATFRQMFEVEYSNMQRIVPIPGDPAEVYAEWREAWDRRMREEDIRCLLEYSGSALRGFMLYCVDEASDRVSIDELQIAPGSQRNGVTFRRLVSRFLHEAEAGSCRCVRAYINRRNPRVLALAMRLGFEVCGEAERGRLVRIDRAALIRRLGRLRERRRR